jgi:hypothetical protein
MTYVRQILVAVLLCGLSYAQIGLNTPVQMNVWAVPYTTSTYSPDGLNVACPNGGGAVDTFLAANARATILPGTARCVDQTPSAGPYSSPTYSWTGFDAMALNYLNSSTGLAGTSANATGHLAFVVQHQANPSLSPPGYTPPYIVTQGWADAAICGTVNSPIGFLWAANQIYQAGWQTCFKISGTNYYFQTTNAISCLTGSSTPAFTIGGTNISDGGCVWNYVGIHALPQDVVTNGCSSTGTYGFVAPWQAGQPYSLGNQVTAATLVTGGVCYKVTTAGTSGGSQPACITTNTCGATVTDNTVTWTKETSNVVLNATTETGAPDSTCTGCGTAGSASVLAQSFLVPFEQPYMVWVARLNRDVMIHTLAANYGQYVDYERFGWSLGGEHSPELMTIVETVLPVAFQDDESLEAEWVGGAEVMMRLNSAWWVNHCQGTGGCNFKMVAAVNCGAGLPNTPGGVDCTWAADEALYAASLPGYIVGSNGVAGFQCNGCTQPGDLTANASGAPTSNGNSLWHPLLYGKTTIIEQMANCSTPVSTCPQASSGTAVGDLRVILPFATQSGVNILEIYEKDWKCAFLGTSCSTQASYLQAFINASQGIPTATGQTVGSGNSVGAGTMQ